MEAVTVKCLENLQQLVVTSSHAFVSDEPEEMGDDLGPTPYELLLSALGTCTAMTILLYVRRKGWPLKSVTVECSHERVHCKDMEACEEEDDTRIDFIRRYILLEGDLSDEQKERISHIARRCPVHRTLEAQPRIQDEVDLVKGE